MKIVITESKREQLVDKILSDEYGDLKNVSNKHFPNITFFVKYETKPPAFGNTVFYFKIEERVAVIPWGMVKGIKVFTLSDNESKQFVISWLRKHYHIGVIKLGVKHD
jgi:hypothetical protein